MAKRIDFENAVVLITGAGAGIGRALSEEALRRGAHVIAVERDAEALESLSGSSLTKAVADVCDAERMREIVAQVLADHGRLDVAIANAGIEKIDPIWAQDPKDFESVINVNVLGVYRTLQPCLAPIIQSGGHLFAVSSIAGIIPFPFGAAYSTSKAAVDMMMRVMRLELLATEATAGAAYFGFIASEMGERVTAHPGVAALSKWMPRPLLGLTPYLTPQQAAERVLNDIEKRKARSYTPGVIRLTYALRGLYTQSDDFLGRHVMGLPKFIKNHYGLPFSDKSDGTSPGQSRK